MVFVQLLYPIVLLILCGLLAVLYSIWLVPEFERMFDDFGISLPPSTSMVITIADWIRRFGVYVSAILGIGLIYQLVVTFRPNIWRTSSALIDAKGHRFENAKSTWARWAWHVATLLEAGVDTNDAIRIAGDGSGKHWMKTCCDDWVAGLGRGDNPFRGFLQVNGVPIPSIGHAMMFANADDQAAMLRDVALNYRDVNRSQTLWWSAWLTPITIVL
jgi:type II secretory pathway component PulF